MEDGSGPEFEVLCMGGLSLVLGIMEMTFLNCLSHHLQLCKDHFRDPAVPSSPLRL